MVAQGHALEDELGDEIDQGREHEVPLSDGGVGQGAVVVVAEQRLPACIDVQQEVEIEGTGVPADPPRTTVGTFDGVEVFEQGARGTGRPQLERGVEKRLARRANRGGLEDGRGARDLDERSPCDRFDGGAKGGFTIAEVAAKTHVSAGVHGLGGRCAGGPRVKVPVRSRAVGSASGTMSSNVASSPAA